MHTSEGNGGCCDCGDKEAWKKWPSCESCASPKKVSYDDGDLADITAVYRTQLEIHLKPFFKEMFFYRVVIFKCANFVTIFGSVSVAMKISKGFHLIWLTIIFRLMAVLSLYLN